MIKIDVEGFELEVFKGMLSLLKLRPLIICEILPVYNIHKENGRKRWERQSKLQGILKENEYSIFLINEQAGTLNYLEDFFAHGSMQQTNYLFVHQSLSASFHCYQF